MFNKKTHDPDFEANPEFEQECLYCKRTILSCQEMQNSRHHYSADRSRLKTYLEKFEPSEELYERMVKEAHERGLLKED